MKVKKQGWINLYRDFWGGYYGMSVFPTEEEAKYAAYKDTSTTKNVATAKIEWEEEE